MQAINAYCVEASHTMPDHRDDVSVQTNLAESVSIFEDGCSLWNLPLCLEKVSATHGRSNQMVLVENFVLHYSAVSRFGVSI